ncbi:hypothetical protein [Streptomyces spiralis]
MTLRQRVAGGPAVDGARGRWPTYREQVFSFAGSATAVLDGHGAVLRWSRAACDLRGVDRGRRPRTADSGAVRRGAPRRGGRARWTGEGGCGLFLVARLGLRWGGRYGRGSRTSWSEQALAAPAAVFEALI